MTRVVEVRTGARLHFGLFTTGPNDGPFGGIGMMIDRPGFVLRGGLSEQDVIDGGDPFSVERIRRWLWELAKLRRRTAERRGGGIRSVHVEVRDSIPPHHGFGSGTQLALGLAELLTRLGVATVDDRSKTFGRGRRSTVGTLGFDVGGFVVDAGANLDERFDRRITLADVPTGWRFVIVDPSSSDTWSGSAETEAFRALRPIPAGVTERLGGLTADVILPGLAIEDFAAFAAGVADFNRLVGEHFAPVQGGVYAHPLIRDLSRTLERTSWPRLAQSSWGPAAAVFCENADSAEALRLFLSRRIDPAEADVFIAAPKNDAATISDLDQP